MGTMVVRKMFQGNKRCELCHKIITQGYSIILDGIPVLVCSGKDAEEARRRWQEKKDLGIKPGVPAETQHEEMGGDNINDLEGGE